MVENEEITGTMRGDSDGDLVSDFIGSVFLCIVTKYDMFLTAIFFFIPQCIVKQITFW